MVLAGLKMFCLADEHNLSISVHNLSVQYLLQCVGFCTGHFVLVYIVYNILSLNISSIYITCTKFSFKTYKIHHGFFLYNTIRLFRFAAFLVQPFGYGPFWFAAFLDQYPINTHSSISSLATFRTFWHAELFGSEYIKESNLYILEYY